MKSFVLLLMLLVTSCSTYRPITATSNKLGSAEGEACARSFFFIPFSSDNTIYTAAKNGDIEKISTVDQHSLFTLIYNHQCTVVRGHKKAVPAPQEFSKPAPVPEIVSEETLPAAEAPLSEDVLEE